MEFKFTAIGVVRSVFTEKFGVPRQAGMVREARSVLKLNADPAFRAALNHMEGYSHLWIVFVFHQHLNLAWRPTIRPPRLEAPRRVGVFASRSSHRPNPIGISAVKLERIDFDAPGGIELHLSGIDLIDGTPVLDIKPYLKFADSIPSSVDGWAEGEIPQYRVEFSEEGQRAIREIAASRYPNFEQLLIDTLKWDPRPMSQRRAMPITSCEHEGRVFGFRLLDFETQWQIRDGAIRVVSVSEGGAS